MYVTTSCYNWGGTKVKSDDNITEDTEKVEEEIAPLNTNTEIMNWEDYMTSI